MKICVPIQAKTQREVKRRLAAVAKSDADLGEIWLDQISDLDIKSLLKEKPIPVVCVCKKPIEKGKFKGTYAQIADLLIKASSYGADYIDIPLNMPKKLNKKIVQKAKKSRIIIAYHDFKKTPTDAQLRKKVKEMKIRGADVIKIAAMSKSDSDMIRMIVLAKELQLQKIPHIIIPMGVKGVLGRILTPTLGGEMMFAPFSKGKGTAPGQLTVLELKDAWSLIE